MKDPKIVLGYSSIDVVYIIPHIKRKVLWHQQIRFKISHFNKYIYIFKILQVISICSLNFRYCWLSVRNIIIKMSNCSLPMMVQTEPKHVDGTIQNIFFIWRNSPTPLPLGQGLLFTRFLDHTQRRTTPGSTPLDERSARRRNLYVTTHNTHNKHPCPRGIRTHNLNRRAAADLRLRPRGYWERL